MKNVVEDDPKIARSRGQGGLKMDRAGFKAKHPAVEVRVWAQTLLPDNGERLQVLASGDINYDH